VGGGNGIAFSNVGTWRCDRGSFLTAFANHTPSGDLFRQQLIAPPQCQIFPCAPGLRCSVNPTDATRNVCIADGSLSVGVGCNDDAACQSGLTCQSRASPNIKVCQ
jgi:hypothetical protein